MCINVILLLSTDYMEKSMNSAWKVFEINDVDINYKAVVKSPIKFTQVSAIPSCMLFL